MAVVTISRQLGSEGDEVAKNLALQLGYAFVDRDTMVAAAQEQGVAIGNPLVPEIDEKKPSFFERLGEERRRYNLLLRYLVYDFAQRDNCVIVGHGGEAFLAGLQHVLRLKLISPLESRVKRVMASHNLPREQALTMVRQSDRERAGYVKYLFHQDWLNPENYDLVINTDRIDPQTLTSVVSAIVKGPSLWPAPSSLQSLADRALASRVEMHLLLDPRIGSTSLRVVANSGTVTITGTLGTDEEREIAEMVANDTPGVTRTISELVVVPITSTLYP